MSVDWSNVETIDDKRDGHFRSRIIFKDGSTEPRVERLDHLSRLWKRHLATTPKTPEGETE